MKLYVQYTHMRLQLYLHQKKTNKGLDLTIISILVKVLNKLYKSLKNFDNNIIIIGNHKQRQQVEKD